MDQKTLRGYIVTGEGSHHRRVPVGTSLVVGRSVDAGLVLKDTSASRRHVEIRATGGGYVCRDLGSRTGTKVNGSTVTICASESSC